MIDISYTVTRYSKSPDTYKIYHSIVWPYCNTSYPRTEEHIQFPLMSHR